MTYTAIRKAMKKAGFPITEADREHGSYFTVAHSPSHRIQWCERKDEVNGSVQSVYVLRNGQHDDSRSDYFPGYHSTTIKSAIQWASPV
jgi:hypothetical protein